MMTIVILLKAQHLMLKQSHEMTIIALILKTQIEYIALQYKSCFRLQITDEANTKQIVDVVH